jgi:hypothetical protein
MSRPGRALQLIGAIFICVAIAICLLNAPSQEALYWEDMHNSDVAAEADTDGPVAIVPPASMKYLKRRLYGYGIGAFGTLLVGLGYFVIRRSNNSGSPS